MTDWNPGGVLWNYCCADSDPNNYYECAHDRETNENKFMCYDASFALKCTTDTKCSDNANHQELAPYGFEKEYLETPDDMGLDMYDHAKAAGAYIHSDSWGGSTPAYDVQVNQVDTYAWNNLNFLPMFAAGNAGEDAEADSPMDANGTQHTYTDGRGTLGNPTNAKNCISVGAALSDNSEPIDNSELANKLGSYWDSKTDWTWQVDIDGSEGVHWSNALIRGLRADVSITEPAGGSHSLAPSAAVVANPVDLCGAITNTAQMSGKVVIFRWSDCLGLNFLQEMVTAGAVGIIMYTLDRYTSERFQVYGNFGSTTGWTIPIIVVPGKEGELLKQLVAQRGEGVTLGISGPILPPTNNFDNMASFSSLGPTYDWRIKPYLVAPGDSIYSADVLTDAEVAAGDTCGRVDMDGTSMATPIAAGAVTLLRQYFTEGFYPSGEKTSADGFNPSAALLKAVMINGAQALKGFESDGWPIDPPPSLKQGWGRIELAASVPLPSSVDVDVSAENTPTNLIIVDDVDDKITESSERGLCVDVDGSIEDLRATLVWTDYPGSTAAEGALVNNLDLQLIKGGDVLWPLSGDDLDGEFHFNGDYYNNVERVIWSKPEVGRYWINVKPTRVQVAQPFALAVTGQVTEVANMTKDTCSHTHDSSINDSTYDDATAGNLTEGECCVVFYGTTPEEMMSYLDLNEPPADVCAYCEPGFICRESVQPVFGEGSTFTGTEVNATSRDCVSYNYTQESCTYPYHWLSMNTSGFPCMSNETAQEFPASPADVRRGRTRRRRGNVRRVPSRVGQCPRRRPFLGDRNLLRIEMQRDVILVERERGRRRRCERRVRDVELGFERRERRRRRREWRGRRRRRIRSRVSSARRRVRSNGRRHRGHARRRSLWIRSRDRRAREAAGDRCDERDVDRRGGSRVRVERRRGGLGAPRVGHRHRRGGTVQGSGESVQRRRAHRVRNPGVVGGVKPRRRARVRVDQGCDRAGLETRRGYRSVLARERRRGGVIRKRHALGHRREARRRARHRFRFGHRVQPNRRSVRAATLSVVRRLGTQRIFRRDVARRRRRGVRVAVQGRHLHRGRRERRHRQGVPIDGRDILGRPLVGVVDPARRGHRRRRRG